MRRPDVERIELDANITGLSHVADGVGALVRYIWWLEETLDKEKKNNARTPE